LFEKIGIIDIYLYNIAMVYGSLTWSSRELYAFLMSLMNKNVPIRQAVIILNRNKSYFSHCI